MRISDTRTTVLAGSKKIKKTESSASFTVATEEVSTNMPARNAAPLTSINTVLMAQGTEQEESKHTRMATVRAETLLEQLDKLRIGLLSGGIPQQQLLNLQKMVSTRRLTVTDPHLLTVIDDIDLRVRVELAKYLR